MNLRVTTSLGLGGLLLIASGLLGLQAANASPGHGHGPGDRPHGYSSHSASPSASPSESPSPSVSPSASASPTPLRTTSRSTTRHHPTPSPTAASLPVTGSRVGPIVLAGLLLLFCGGLLVLARVRRPAAEPGH